MAYYKRLQIDSLIHMSDEAAPPQTPPCMDNLMNSALDALDLFRIYWFACPTV
jgi:hypothetical protein